MYNSFLTLASVLEVSATYHSNSYLCEYPEEIAENLLESLQLIGPVSKQLMSVTDIYYRLRV